MSALWLVLACADPGMLPVPTGRPEVVLRVSLEGRPKSGGGKVVVQADYAMDGTATVPEPEAEGLSFVLDGPPTREIVGDRAVVTQRYVFRGGKGSYEIAPLTATWTGSGDAAAEAQSATLFVDIDVEGPRQGELADIAEPAQVWRIPWIPVGVVGALVAGGLWLAFRPRPVAVRQVKARLPPDEEAILAWEAVRDERDLPIEEKAKHLSRIFRVYTEAVLGFEATSRTTSELLEHLSSLMHLPEGNIPRARRVLRAADRIKFAEEQPAGGWLEEMDSDLRAFIDSTKPSAWKGEA